MKSSILIILLILLSLGNILLLDIKTNPFKRIENKFLKFNASPFFSKKLDILTKILKEKSNEEEIKQMN